MYRADIYMPSASESLCALLQSMTYIYIIYNLCTVLALMVGRVYIRQIRARKPCCVHFKYNKVDIYIENQDIKQHKYVFELGNFGFDNGFY